MGTLLDLVKRVEQSLYTATGRWMLEVSEVVDTLSVTVAGLVAAGPAGPDATNLIFGPTGQEQVPSVLSTPGWMVVGDFYLDAIVDDAFFEAIFLNTAAGLTGRVKLFDTVASADVAGSILSTSSTTDVRLISADIAAGMPGNRIYQVQAECTGATGQFVIVRAAKLIAERS